MSSIPSEEDCIRMLLDAGCKRRVVIHCCTVEAVAKEMLSRITDADPELTMAGALLHDIGRSVACPRSWWTSSGSTPAQGWTRRTSRR